MAKKRNKIVAERVVPETRSNVVEISISDPALAQYLGIAGMNTGLTVSETTAMGIPGYYRAISIVAGTIAGLPLKTYRRLNEEDRERVGSFLDDPAGPYPLTPFAWKEMVMLHLLNQGETFLMHVYNGAGALVGLWPVHPKAVSVEWAGADKLFTVEMSDGTDKKFSSQEMTQIMALTFDGLRGIAPITLFRQAIKIGLASELAALRSFTDGMLISGLVTPVDEDITEDEAKEIKRGLQAKIAGVENSGDIAVVNRALKFSPWAMSHADAQFLESREFQIIEFARMIGVPPHLVGATEKQTSWGSGVAEQNLGLARYTLMGWTTRIEEALSTLLPTPRFVEFDYKKMLQGSPAEEIRLLLEQVKGGLLTVDEARRIMNMPPMPKSEQPQPEQEIDGGEEDAKDSTLPSE
jgi:HK97 family phage portal protein